MCRYGYAIPAELIAELIPSAEPPVDSIAEVTAAGPDDAAALPALPRESIALAPRIRAEAVAEH